MQRRKCTLRQITFQALLVAAWATAAWAPASHGQEGVRIELNKLEPLDSACRAYLLFENRMSEDFRSLKLDLVMFNPEGIINRRLAVEGGPLPAAKTSVKLFDIQGVTCDAVSRVLLNGVLGCSVVRDGTEQERQDCLQLIETASRSGTEFFK